MTPGPVLFSLLVWSSLVVVMGVFAWILWQLIQEKMVGDHDQPDSS